MIIKKVVYEFPSTEMPADINISDYLKDKWYLDTDPSVTYQSREEAEAAMLGDDALIEFYKEKCDALTKAIVAAKHACKEWAAIMSRFSDEYNSAKKIKDTQAINTIKDEILNAICTLTDADKTMIDDIGYKQLRYMLKILCKNHIKRTQSTLKDLRQQRLNYFRSLILKRYGPK